MYKVYLLAREKQQVFQPGGTMDLTRLNYAELAKALRVQPCTVRFWTRHGLPYEPTGRLRFYDLNKVKTWLREQDEKKKAAKQREAA